MLIKKPSDIKPSEITSKAVYLQRREFIKAASTASIALAIGGIGVAQAAKQPHGAKLPFARKSAFNVTEEFPV